MPVEEIRIDWRDIFKPIEGLKSDNRYKVIIKREVIPIIFVPGIMGSRLKNDQGKKVWDPDSKLFMFWNYGLFSANARKKKEMLIGRQFQSSYLDVYDDEVHDGLSIFMGAKQRGWGGVLWSSYGDILGALQNQFWSEPIRHCFDLPVHAFAYNWTSSNDLSGLNLKSYIDDVMQEYSDCKKVILVTHSMGGLVARAACELHGARDKVLGVVHGVQPALGAAAAYWRMKAGFERPDSQPDKELMDWWRNPLKTATDKPVGTVTSWVLGSHGEEVTALLGNMPGGLELLPSNNYTDNDNGKTWLKFKDADLTDYVELPKFDVYEEIYKESDRFYRLVNPSWLDPGGTQDPVELTSWDNYEIYLKKAENFHRDLEMKLHPKTIQFYANDLNTTDRIIFDREVHSWSNKAKRLGRILKKEWSSENIPKKVTFKAVKALIFGFNLPTAAAGEAIWTIVKDTDAYVRRGGYRAYVDENDKVINEDSEKKLAIIYLMSLKEPLIQDLQKQIWKGDGTVSVASGKSLNARETVCIGQDNEPWWERGHEPIFKTKSAKNITFAAIENFCLQRINEEVDQ